MQTLGHYRLVQQLGAGTYGVVWRGEHEADPELQVAVKVFKPEFAQDPTWRAAMQAEYRRLHAMDHPAIVRFRDLIVDSGQIAMVLELLRGRDLLDHIRAEGPLSVDETCRILETVLDALAYAHGLRLVHRDIKPQNTFITEDGRTKLLDFGIARATDGTRASRTGMVAGTLDYMAPEMFEGVVRPGCDVYAAGIVAWEMLAGRTACPEGTLASKMRWHITLGPPDVRQERPDCPEWLALLVARLTEKDPDARPADGAAALALLREGRAPRPAPASPPSQETFAAPPPPPPRPPPRTAPPRPRRRPLWPFLLVGTGLLVLLGGITLLSLGGTAVLGLGIADQAADLGAFDKDTGWAVPAAGYGVLQVESQPPGATVILNGVNIGVTPLSGPLPPGTHHLRVEAWGSNPQERTVTVTPGEITPVWFTL